MKTVTRTPSDVCLYAGQAYTRGAARDGQVCELDPHNNEALVWRKPPAPAMMSFPSGRQQDHAK